MESETNNPPAGEAMTMRDYFAAAALQGLIASEQGELSHIHGAADAYRYADAMLKERSK